MLDDDGYAPLHLIVKRQYGNRIDLIMTLMTYSNARIDVTTTKEGMSALHLAVEVCARSIYTKYQEGPGIGFLHQGMYQRCYTALACC